MVDASNSAERRAAAAEAFAIGARLTQGQEIACPDALCAAIGCRRQTYDDTVKRHRNGRRRKVPTRGATARMFVALRAAGDRRFTEELT